MNPKRLRLATIALRFPVVRPIEIPSTRAFCRGTFATIRSGLSAWIDILSRSSQVVRWKENPHSYDHVKLEGLDALGLPIQFHIERVV